VDDAGFLHEPELTDAARQLYDHDRDDRGYVMNLSRLWAHLPAAHARLLELMAQTAGHGQLTLRQRGVLISACASTLGDSYCSLAWGSRLAGEAGADVAGAVLVGDDAGLDPAERALARWARRLASDPNGAEAAEVQALRDAGYDDDQIFAITLFVALRMAFSTVNDALGARPDRELHEAAPTAVRDAVSFGRPAAR
jgi:alkylhydroperoxidase family enzyme